LVSLEPFDSISSDVEVVGRAWKYVEDKEKEGDECFLIASTIITHPVTSDKAWLDMPCYLRDTEHHLAL
jgi:hypothetical protein